MATNDPPYGEKNINAINYDIRKILIENLIKKIQDLENTRKNLFFGFGAIIIAVLTILGTLTAQLFNPQIKTNIILNYSTNCDPYCPNNFVGNLTNNFTGTCTGNFGENTSTFVGNITGNFSGTLSGINNCINVSYVSMNDPQFSIYQFLFHQNLFNVLLVLGSLFLILIIIFWRYTELQIIKDEINNRNLLKERIKELPINLEIETELPSLQTVDLYFTEKDLESIGKVRKWVIIFLSWIFFSGLMRIIPQLFWESFFGLLSYLSYPLEFQIIQHIFINFPSAIWEILFKYLPNYQTIASKPIVVLLPFPTFFQNLLCPLTINLITIILMIIGSIVLWVFWHWLSQYILKSH
jgi:hypothetical protein